MIWITAFLCAGGTVQWVDGEDPRREPLLRRDEDQRVRHRVFTLGRTAGCKALPDDVTAERQRVDQDSTRLQQPRPYPDVLASAPAGCALHTGRPESAGRMWIVLRPCFCGLVVMWA